MAQPLTKAVIVESIRSELNIPKSSCTAMVEILIDMMKATLASGEDVLISGFGKSNVKD